VNIGGHRGIYAQRKAPTSQANKNNSQPELLQYYTKILKY